MKDEQRWVKEAREGSHAAFEELVKGHINRVYRLALGHTGSHHDAEEITQIVFLNAWKGLPAFRGESAFGTWLYRLTQNACADFYRQNKKRKGDLSLDDPEGPVLLHQGLTPEETAARREDQALLRKALDRLPEHHRTVLLLRELEGLEYREIANLLDLEVGTVRSRLSRARKALANLLREQGNFSDRSPSNPTKGGMEDEKL